MADAVYLSLGDQEKHVKNQAIARVGDSLRAQYALLQEQLGSEHCTLVWEQGNHFNDNEGRLARAFAWCIERIGGRCDKAMETYIEIAEKTKADAMELFETELEKE